VHQVGHWLKLWQCTLSRATKISFVSRYSRTRHSRSSLICSECIWRLVQYGQRKDIATVRKDTSVQMLITVMALNKFPQRQPGHYVCILLWRVIVMEKKVLKHALWKKLPLDRNIFSCLLFHISYSSLNPLKHGKYKHMYHIFLILWNSEFCTFPGVIFSGISSKKALDLGLTFSNPTLDLVRQYDFPVLLRCRKKSDMVFVAVVRPLSEPVRRFSSCSMDFSQQIAHVVLFLFLHVFLF
jgi:hypothetical protein